ncbi:MULTISPECIES: hypothetical protein [Bradyrhizobium]|nr:MULTISPECIES: hypothetical protein [Bradyrhizobium]
MTIHLASPTISDEELEKRFVPVFEKIAVGAVSASETAPSRSKR